MGSTQGASATTSLQQMFPSADPQLIQDIIHHCQGDVEEAAVRLLDVLSSTSPASQVDCCPAVQTSSHVVPLHLQSQHVHLVELLYACKHVQGQRTGLGRGRHPGKAAALMGWSALTAQHTGKASPGSTRNPAAQLDSAYPELSPATPMQPSSTAKHADGGRGMACGSSPPGQPHAWAYAEAASHAEAPIKRLSHVHPWADEALLTVSPHVCSAPTEPSYPIAFFHGSDSLALHAGCAVCSRAEPGGCSMDAIRAARPQHSRRQPCHHPQRKPAEAARGPQGTPSIATALPSPCALEQRCSEGRGAAARQGGARPR